MANKIEVKDLLEAHTLEMLSNGTIDGFIVSVSEEAQKNQDYDHFSAIINRSEERRVGKECQGLCRSRW